jgi:hypothetical protein
MSRIDGFSCFGHSVPIPNPLSGDGLFNKTPNSSVTIGTLQSGDVNLTPVTGNINLQPILGKINLNSDVHIDDVPSGIIVTGGFLGLNSTNDVVKAVGGGSGGNPPLNNVLTSNVNYIPYSNGTNLIENQNFQFNGFALNLSGTNGISKTMLKITDANLGNADYLRTLIGKNDTTRCFKSTYNDDGVASHVHHSINNNTFHQIDINDTSNTIYHTLYGNINLFNINSGTIAPNSYLGLNISGYVVKSDIPTLTVALNGVLTTANTYIPFSNGTNLIEDTTFKYVVGTKTLNVGYLGINGTNNIITSNSSVSGEFSPLTLATGNTTRTYNFEIGTENISRPQLWFKAFNPTAGIGNRGSIFRLGSLAQDGDPTTYETEGAVFYGLHTDGATMDTTNWSYARIKPTRLGLLNSASGVQNYLFRVDTIADEFYLKQNGGTKVFEFTRATEILNLGGTKKITFNPTTTTISTNSTNNLTVSPGGNILLSPTGDTYIEEDLRVYDTGNTSQYGQLNYNTNQGFVMSNSKDDGYCFITGSIATTFDTSIAGVNVNGKTRSGYSNVLELHGVDFRYYETGGGSEGFRVTPWTGLGNETIIESIGTTKSLKLKATGDLYLNPTGDTFIEESCLVHDTNDLGSFIKMEHLGTSGGHILLSHDSEYLTFTGGTGVTAGYGAQITLCGHSSSFPDYGFLTSNSYFQFRNSANTQTITVDPTNRAITTNGIMSLISTASSIALNTNTSISSSSITSSAIPSGSVTPGKWIGLSATNQLVYGTPSAATTIALTSVLSSNTNYIPFSNGTNLIEDATFQWDNPGSCLITTPAQNNYGIRAFNDNMGNGDSTRVGFGKNVTNTKHFKMAYVHNTTDGDINCTIGTYGGDAISFFGDGRLKFPRVTSGTIDVYLGLNSSGNVVTSTSSAPNVLLSGVLTANNHYVPYSNGTNLVENDRFEFYPNESCLVLTSTTGTTKDMLKLYDSNLDTNDNVNIGLGKSDTSRYEVQYNDDSVASHVSILIDTKVAHVIDKIHSETVPSNTLWGKVMLGTTPAIGGVNDQLIARSPINGEILLSPSSRRDQKNILPDVMPNWFDEIDKLPKAYTCIYKHSKQDDPLEKFVTYMADDLNELDNSWDTFVTYNLITRDFTGINYALMVVAALECIRTMKGKLVPALQTIKDLKETVISSFDCIKEMKEMMNPALESIKEMKQQIADLTEKNQMLEQRLKKLEPITIIPELLPVNNKRSAINSIDNYYQAKKFKDK